MTNEPRIEEQALSQAAEIGISSQLDDAEEVSVDVRTDLLKMVQGQADSVSFAGQGLVMQKDIRVQEIELQLDGVAINPLSALFGKLELDRPVDASARLVMTEQDINRALNSDYIRSQMQSIELNVENQTVSLEMQQMELLLPEDGKMVFNAKTLLHEIGGTRQVSFSSAFRPRTSSQPVILQKFDCTEGEGISLELTLALMKKINEWVHLPYLELDKMAFRIEEMEVHPGTITLRAEAHVVQLPS